MNNPRFPQDEFDTLFPGPFESDQEKRREYETFLLTLQQLEEVPVPELSAREKAEIFRHAWPQPTPNQSLLWAWLALLRRPAVTFAFGIAIGCAVMFTCLRARPAQAQPAPPEPLYAVEQIGNTQTYEGKVLQHLYPQIEDPTLVVERRQETSEPRRVLRGTLDKGKIQVLWNL